MRMPTADIKSMIIAAIADRAVLRIAKLGEGDRIVEPHLLGYRGRGRDLQLSAYQVEGVSKSGKRVGWKYFSIREITKLERTGATFPGPRVGYNPNDKSMSSIVARIR